MHDAFASRFTNSPKPGRKAKPTSEPSHEADAAASFASRFGGGGGDEDEGGDAEGAEVAEGGLEATADAVNAGATLAG